MAKKLRGQTKFHSLTLMAIQVDSVGLQLHFSNVYIFKRMCGVDLGREMEVLPISRTH